MKRKSFKANLADRQRAAELLQQLYGDNTKEVMDGQIYAKTISTDRETRASCADGLGEDSTTDQGSTFTYPKRV